MKQKCLTGVALICLCVATVVITIHSVVAQLPDGSGFESPSKPVPEIAVPPKVTNRLLSTACAFQPERDRAQQAAIDRAAWSTARGAAGSVTLARFRQIQPVAAPGENADSLSAKAIDPYAPREEIALADPTNYGDRYLRDINGNPASLDPIVVLHETVGSASSAINLFRTPHPRDDDQVSYHALIKRNGTVVYIVPPDKRAFGAGNSAFSGAGGLEAVQTNPLLAASVNNFAYHISLESPPDGNGNSYRHSGYTAAQYQSAAWLVSKTGVPDSRVTTHRAVDRSRQRIDPRSFNFTQFTALLSRYPRTTEVLVRCTDPMQLSN